MNKNILTDKLETREFREVTLSGETPLQEKRVKVLTDVSLMFRITDPEVYLLLRNIALQIHDQLED